MSAVITGGAPAGRSAAFLEEIGVGPLWRLRRPVAREEDAEPAGGEGADLRPAAASITAPPAAALTEPSDAVAASSSVTQDPAPAPCAGAPVPTRAAPDAAAESTPPSTEARIAPTGDDLPDESSPSAPRAVPDDDSTARFEESSLSAPRAVPDDDSTARFDESSPSAPRAAPDDDSTARFDESSLSAPRAVPDDDSTAWFDDAPAPPAPVAVTAEAIAQMDWDELKTAAAKCTRCALSRTRRAVVFGRGDTGAALMLLASAPGRADEREGVAIGDDAGVLLENMLRAAGFAADAPRSGYYVSHLVKCRPCGGDGAERAPAPDEIAACRPYLERELALTGARTVVTLGQPALRGLLGAGVPAARGAVQHIQSDARSVAVVATYHPADLLRQGENKAGAWADLCLARQTHGAGAA